MANKTVDVRAGSVSSQKQTTNQSYSQSSNYKTTNQYSSNTSISALRSYTRNSGNNILINMDGVENSQWTMQSVLEGLELNSQNARKYKNNLDQDDVFSGPVAEWCINCYTQLTNDINETISKFVEIDKFLGEKVPSLYSQASKEMERTFVNSRREAYLNRGSNDNYNSSRYVIDDESYTSPTKTPSTTKESSTTTTSSTTKTSSPTDKQITKLVSKNNNTSTTKKKTTSSSSSPPQNFPADRIAILTGKSTASSSGFTNSGTNSIKFYRIGN